MSKYKVLYVVHNHPTVRPGGAEAYALELYETMRLSDEFEPILLARTGPPMSKLAQNHPGTVFAPINDDPHQYVIYTDAANYDWFNGTPRNKDLLTEYYARFLDVFRPDVVHFQHTLYLGYDMLLQTRRSLPHAAILYTLHEYIPICHRDGQMVQKPTEEPCSHASPQRCHECFPEISPQAFFMRKRFIQAHFSLVDLFIAPSRFLLERYIDWGIPREKIHYEEYGRLAAQVLGGETRTVRNRFAFFGQINPFKGAHVLLNAVEILAKEPASPAKKMESGISPTPHIWIHGANLDLQQPTFKTNIGDLIASVRGHVTFAGPYDKSKLPELVANIDWVVVPSVWWENSPLVIQEAFQHGRPVICSGIGGMAEKVANRVNGLHFRAGDPADLAKTIRHAMSTPGLWEKLRTGISPVYSIEDHTAKLIEIYNDLMRRKYGRASMDVNPPTVSIDG
jgi:glycosyltransferase involved in cell wall biosynthesis